ncbi:hypothetical protein BIV57_19965 [Mangrovactinospora gilvigrisea]|uniref:DUF4389 domain-containing protein n=2 Tax=Mangrovactinospora gilvigrisea TaxID=1428644 RepID=A0A1J7C2H8_9ACTN|nr:hypothetical protein BIV57_19965 [Mangrovactinospora gilvigrisea]
MAEDEPRTKAAPPSAPRNSVRVEVDEGTPSRWIWIFKWLLLIPHYLVLLALHLAVAVVWVVALFWILLCGHYPRPLFDFSLGVLRWTWRVGAYGYAGLVTDEYPPFSLAERPEYPARVTVDHQEHYSRGLVLVKWWLLALPQYVLVSTFTGSLAVLGGGGLALTLTLYAGIALLFTGRYPRGIFDLVIGLHRWQIRVFAYVGLLTDEYPPFRLDQGGSERAEEV